MRRKNVVVVTGTCVVLAAVLFIVGLPPVISAAAGSSGYKILKTIHVPGTEGWDYVTMDSDARRLYIGRGNHIDVVNVDSGAVVGKVTGLEGTSGLLPVPELGRGFAMNGPASSAPYRRLEEPE